jgi:hypothetical protein
MECLLPVQSSTKLMFMRAPIFILLLTVFVLYSCFTGRTPANSSLGNYQVTVMAHDREGAVDKVMKTCSSERISSTIETSPHGSFTDLIKIAFKLTNISESRIAKINDDLLSTTSVVNVNITKVH